MIVRVKVYVVMLQTRNRRFASLIDDENHFW